MALPSFKVLTLTDTAADRVKSIIAKADKPIVGVRVGVKNGGCAGMSYTMEYADSINPTKLSSQFVFNNPNQTSACGCGESVAITPVTPDSLQPA
jgi:iron-sulfur cluster assembly protein